jgi:hypothetical protein
MKDKVEVSRELAEYFKSTLEKAVRDGGLGGEWQKKVYDTSLLRYYDEVTDTLGRSY